MSPKDERSARPTAELEAERNGATLTLRLARPARRNALTGTLIAALREAFRTAAADTTVRAIVLAGRGPAFCSGLDLHELAAAAEQSDAFDTTPLLELYEQLEASPQPIIAAAPGPAAAGGAVLLLLADVALLTPTASVGFPGIRHGLLAPIVLPYLTRAVGARRARYLLLTGTMLAPETAQAWGLADEIVDEDQLAARAAAIADGLSRVDPVDVREIRTALRTLAAAEQTPATLGRAFSQRLPLRPPAQAALRRFATG